MVEFLNATAQGNNEVTGLQEYGLGVVSESLQTACVAYAM